MKSRQKISMFIRVDGSKRIGLGHIYRTLRLAKYMRRRYECKIVFMARKNQASLDLIRREKFEAQILPFNASLKAELKYMTAYLADAKAQVVLIDLLHQCFDVSYMKALAKASLAPVVVFNDARGVRSIAADIIFNVNAAKSQSSKPRQGQKIFQGYEYLILPEGYADHRPKFKGAPQVKRVAICMGGADHHNLTARILHVLEGSSLKFLCDVVVSSSYARAHKIPKIVAGLNRSVNVHYDTDGLLDVLKKADLAVTAGGYSQVERMAAGVPGLVISQLRHQEQYTQYVSRLGGCIDLGFHKDVSDEKILQGFERLAFDVKKRRDMARRGCELVDGKGLKRIADIIVQAV